MQDANVALLFDRVIHYHPLCLMHGSPPPHVVKAEPGLISKYHMRPVLMVPACPCVASAAMFMSQFGASGWISWGAATTLDTLNTLEMSLLCSSILPFETAHDQTTEKRAKKFQVGYWLA